MRDRRHQFCNGFTLVELAVTAALATVLLLTVGTLMSSGQRAWQSAYNSANKKIKLDAQNVMIYFGSMGRKSNKIDYKIYNYNASNHTFTAAKPKGSGTEEVVSGGAVEFRYWDVELNQGDTHGLMDVTKTATSYAFFYLEGNRLKVDYGTYPPGAVPVDGGLKNGSGITTVVLAENVTTDPNIGAFSNTMINGIGQGSVRINITITDPNDGDSIKIMTATLMRNVWPR